MAKTKRRIKKWPFILAGIVAAAGIGVGLWFFTAPSRAEPVMVFPFSYLGMTEYWGDSRESYGPVTSDKMQTVFVSDTQTITEILVEQGDEVKKGDLLLRYDTTLSDLALERKALEVEKLKLQLEQAKKRLADIKAMRPMQLPQVSEEPEDEETLGRRIEGNYEIHYNANQDGKTNDRAIIVWVRDSYLLSGAGLDDIFAQCREHAVTMQSQNRLPEEEQDAPEPEQPDTPEPEQPADVNTFYIVIRATQGNRILGSKLTWQGMRVSCSGDGFAFTFCNPTAPDFVLDSVQTEQDTPEFDYGSGYTSAQLAQMRAEQEQKIVELDLQIRMAEVDYRLMQLEASDGNVYAQVDGVIVSLLDPEEARLTGQPMLKLFGGGGFYVQGAVSELEKDLLLPGQEVTVSDWNTGMTYVGVVDSVGDFPSQQNGYNGMGNPNASYYPFLVFVDGSADLQEGRYVSILYASSSAQSGIYLENPFIRTENGRSYVMVRGEDGLLEQRFVTTGKALWGSYTEILDGLTEEDYLAFPYAKNIRPGLPTQEGDRSDLYS